MVNIGLSLRNTVFMRDVPIKYYKPDLSRKAEQLDLSLTLSGLETTWKDSTRLYIEWHQLDEQCPLNGTYNLVDNQECGGFTAYCIFFHPSYYYYYFFLSIDLKQNRRKWVLNWKRRELPSGRPSSIPNPRRRRAWLDFFQRNERVLWIYLQVSLNSKTTH